METVFAESQLPGDTGGSIEPKELAQSLAGKTKVRLNQF